MKKINKTCAIAFALSFLSFKKSEVEHMSATITTYYTPEIECILQKKKGYEAFGMGALPDVYVKYQEHADEILKKEGIVCIVYPNKKRVFIRYNGRKRAIEKSPIGSKKNPLTPFKSIAGDKQYFGKSLLMNNDSYRIEDYGQAFDNKSNKFDLYVGVMPSSEYNLRYKFKIVKKITILK